MASRASSAPPAGQTALVALASQNKFTPKQMAAASRMKFAPPEVQRIVNVLDECVRKLDVLAFLPCELIYPNSVSRVLGDAALKSLKDHLRLCDEYRWLQDTTKMQDNPIEQAVQDSLRNFLRYVRPPKKVEALKAALQRAGPINKEEQRVIQKLEARLRELRDMLMERLLTTPQEERERKNHQQEEKRRQRHNAELFQVLEQRMRAATKRRDEMLSMKDENIQRRKDSLLQMEREWEVFVLQVQKKTELQYQTDRKNSEMKCLCLQEEANQLRSQLDQLTMQHWVQEKTLRNKNKKLATEIRNWIQKYDVDMEEKQTKLDELTLMYDEEQAELLELQERFTSLELEFMRIMEERQRERERREEEEREMERKSRAAVIIQALWREWSIRKALKNKPMEKKGMKGDKKKGK